MTLPVIFSSRADRHLRDLRRYLSAAASAGTAADYTARIVRRCLELGDLPHRGRSRPDIGRRLRSIPFEGRATIVYRLRRDLIEIAAIYYGGRQPTRRRQR